MRPFARQGARLAGSSRVRQSSVPRPAPSERKFHTSRSTRAENRPPNTPADNHTSLNERREDVKKHDHASAKSGTEAEAENGEDRSQTRPGTKRYLRGRRQPDVPKPPRIPDWFLKHNVKLLRDSPGMAVSEDRGQVIKCVDAETGHTLFEVPYFEAWPAPAEANAQSRKAALQKDFFDHRVKFEHPQEKKEPAPIKLPSPEGEDAWKNNQMRWVFLEAETSARAALSLPAVGQRSYSVLSNRVDLSLQCPDSNSHDQLDELVKDLARVVQADIVRLDANDIAELAEHYVDLGHDGPGTYSHLGYDVFQDYVANSVSSTDASATAKIEPHEENDIEEEEEDEDDREEAAGRRHNFLLRLNNLRDALRENRSGIDALRNRIVGIGIGLSPSEPRTVWNPQHVRPSRSAFEEPSPDDPRVPALFESVIDAPKYKQSSGLPADSARRTERRKSGAQKDSATDAESSRDYQRVLRHWRTNPALWLPEVAKSLVSYLSGVSKDGEPAGSKIRLVGSASRRDSLLADPTGRRRTIVHVRELRDIAAGSRMGEYIIQQLCRVVQKRRRAGEQILVVGTTASDSFGPIHLPGDTTYMQDFPLRSISVPPLFNLSIDESQKLEAGTASLPSGNLDRPAYRRILEINIRHLQTMLRKLRPDDNIDLSSGAHDQLNLPGMHFLSEKVLPVDEIQRLALIAIGLSQTHAKSERVKPIHIALASFVTTRSDYAVRAWSDFNEKKRTRRFKTNLDRAASRDSSGKETGEARIDRIKKGCNAHETRLLSGVVDPDNIKTTFSEVHAQPDTINALKDLTTLSLLRPEAFRYGVLASDRLPGLLLYGPPGTGKTLLAKAVAKESKATVLEVSGAQVYEKYVGEGEKMVRAVFSLAKKLSPCIVFIDEADAIFGSRSNSGGNRNTHREIINQFLREWDGMDDHSVFMMVASNRPFDLDDAVLRRLPRRLLVDLPVAKDRESILGIHLKNETLDSSVSLSQLAEQTPLYSGSDLKNLSVAAALACVREENHLAAQHKDDAGFRLPDKRTLTSAHFEKALTEISASISEDMSSLAAIRKFDEQYGDRKGRRKKTNYGFGLQDQGIDESAARVRSGSPPPP